jgi:hypothetical protein
MERACCRCLELRKDCCGWQRRNPWRAFIETGIEKLPDPSNICYSEFNVEHGFTVWKGMMK